MVCDNSFENIMAQEIDVFEYQYPDAHILVRYGTQAEALDSLLAQTYQDFKVIMCDDGSSDNTIEVAQGYVDKYPGKFLLIRNERNMKLAATLNHCLEYVDTEYVARMDGDDISLPARLKRRLSSLIIIPNTLWSAVR